MTLLWVLGLVILIIGVVFDSQKRLPNWAFGLISAASIGLFAADRFAAHDAPFGWILAAIGFFDLTEAVVGIRPARDGEC